MKRIVFFVITVFSIVFCFAHSKEDRAISVIAFDQKSGEEVQLPKIDSLYSLLKKAKEDTVKVNLLNTLSWELTYFGNTVAATDLANEAASLSKRINYKMGSLGAYNALANIHARTGDHPEAIKKYFETLKISEELNYKKGIANAYNNIGSVYSNTKNYTEALSNFKAALNISTEIDYKKIIGIAYENIGIIFQLQGNIDEALKNHLAALKIREEMGDQRAVGWSYQNLAIDYASQKNFVLSEEYFSKALKVQEQLGDKYEVCRIYTNIGELCIEQKKYKEALTYCEKGLTLANEIKFIDMIYQIERTISEIYELMGNEKLALLHYKNYKVAKDSAQNVEMSERIVREEMNYKFEKQRQKEELLLAQKEALFAEELKYQKTLTWSGIVGIVLVAFIALILLIGYRRKIRTNDLIAIQREEISRQKAGIEGQEEERKRISKELHDGLGGTLAGIKMNLERIKELPPVQQNEVKKIIANVGDACKEVRTIAHNLMPTSISNVSLSGAMNDLVIKFNDPEKLNISFDCFPEQDINETFDRVKSDVYRIIQECLNNIIKHSAATKVHIGLLKEEDHLLIHVEDNGKGFDTKIASKGIGIRNIEERVKSLGGEIVIDSSVGRGTAINIRIEA